MAGIDGWCMMAFWTPLTARLEWGLGQWCLGRGVGKGGPNGDRDVSRTLIGTSSRLYRQFVASRNMYVSRGARRGASGRLGILGEGGENRERHGMPLKTSLQGAKYRRAALQYLLRVSPWDQPRGFACVLCRGRVRILAFLMHLIFPSGGSGGVDGHTYILSRFSDIASSILYILSNLTN